jgi:hypothetical protein
VRGNSDNAAILASALSKALSELHLTATAEGKVTLDPTEITLARNQTIRLDRESKLRLDPDAKVRADGEMRVQAPSFSVPRTVPKPTSPVPTITNFTVFKQLPFGKGVVMTGWDFLTSTQKSPTHQYCYYTESSDEALGLNVNFDIGHDRRPASPKTPPVDFDMAAAFARCVWFRDAS